MPAKFCRYMEGGGRRGAARRTRMPSQRTWIVHGTLLVLGFALVSLPLAFVTPKGLRPGDDRDGQNSADATGRRANRGSSAHLPSVLLNGDPIEYRLAPPRARLEYVGTPSFETALITVVFGSAWPNPSENPGLQITFYAAVNPAGSQQDFSGEGGGNPVRVTFLPDPIDAWRDHANLAYANWGVADLTGRIEFEELEPEPRGRIKGVLREATLKGFYTDPQFTSFQEPREPMELVLRDFEFDTVIESGADRGSFQSSPAAFDDDEDGSNGEYDYGADEPAEEVADDNEPNSEDYGVSESDDDSFNNGVVPADGSTGGHAE